MCSLSIQPQISDWLSACCPKRNDAKSLLVVASRIIPGKNVSGAIHFFSELHRLIPNACLAIAGEGVPDHVSYCRNLVRHFGLCDRVDFLGHLTLQRLNSLFNAADFLVHLALMRKENIGLALVEAQAAGLPVLASHWAGFRDLIIPEETGFYADTYLTSTGRYANWLSAVLPLTGILTDELQIRSMRLKAIKYANLHYHQEAFFRRLEWLLAEASQIKGNSVEPVRLSDAGKALVIDFMQMALRSPGGGDSKAIAEMMENNYFSDPESPYRKLNAFYATRNSPHSPDGHSVLYRYGRACLADGYRFRIESMRGTREVPCTPAAIEIWQQLSTPTTVWELSERLSIEENHIYETLNLLIDQGVIGCLPQKDSNP